MNLKRRCPSFLLLVAAYTFFSQRSPHVEGFCLDLTSRALFTKSSLSSQMIMNRLPISEKDNQFFKSTRRRYFSCCKAFDSNLCGSVTESDPHLRSIADNAQVIFGIISALACCVLSFVVLRFTIFSLLPAVFLVGKPRVEYL